MEAAIIVEYEAADGGSEVLAALLAEHARRAADEEAGCLRFDVMRATDADGRPMAGRFVAIGLFAGEAALRSYRSRPATVRFEEAAAARCLSRRAVTALSSAPGGADGIRPEDLNAANDG